jgi:hypothetical protein
MRTLAVATALASKDFYTPGAPNPYDGWEKDWTHLTGWKRWLMVSGTVHSSFTDLGPSPTSWVSTSARRSTAIARRPASGRSSTSTCGAGRSPCRPRRRPPTRR